MNKLSAKDVCEILNANKDIKGFCEAIRGRVAVTEEVVNDTEVMCSAIKGTLNSFDSSPLGFINMLVDQPICAVISDDDCTLNFGLVGEEKRKSLAEWEKYEKDLEEYNEKYGTNHKPEARPDNLG